MSKKFILAMDQGTSSCRCLIFDKTGLIYSQSQKQFGQILPKPGWVEQDPEEIWQTQLFTIKDALNKKSISTDEILSIGITNQRETTVLWNRKTGKAVYNAIVWQDTRTSGWCREMIKKGLKEEIQKRTGLIPNPYFSASKIRWILDNIVKPSGVDINEICFGTIDSWLLWKLTAGKVHATEISNASRTMIFNIHELKWDELLLREFSIQDTILPVVKESSGSFGFADVDILKDSGIPISGILGDQQAALYGQDCLKKGMAKNTYGSGCFILMNIGDTLHDYSDGLVNTIAWQTDDKVVYALEGSVFNAGSAIDWGIDNLELVKDVRDSSKIAYEAEDIGDLFLIPALTGLGSPYWDPEVRGAIIGLNRNHTKAHIMRALLESIAYRTKDVLQSMQKGSAINLKELKVDGGVSKNDFLMQFQADILGVNVRRSKMIESTAFGAARMAAYQFSFFDSDAIASGSEVFIPQLDASIVEEKYNKWKTAIGRILST